MTGFDGYMTDFEGARTEALQALDKLTHCKDNGIREELTVDARNCIDEVERYIRILEDEAKQGKDAIAKRKMEDQVRHCKTLHASLRSNLEKQILIGDSRAKTAEAPADMTEKQAMARYADRLETNGRHLDEAQRTIAETEAIAANTANNLLHQRNQLQHAQVDVDQAQEDTKEAGSHIRRMARKALTNKIVLLFLILCLAAAIALVSYFKWYPRDRKDILGILPTQAPSSG
ncbi:hypothetical protein PINS_up008448 [Pythium insidiosum]|nr:hypothetical protein PINS_up008448 [Pythium insidiosum]